MNEPSSGVAWGNWLVSKASGLLDARLSRRSFIARTTLFGSAVAASGVAIAGCNTPPYQSITGCPPGTLCTDGYTEFCCVINSGINACPPGTFPAGWWRADGSIYCSGGSRYYIDCNESCCGPGLGNGFCAGCSPCRCATDCNTRKVHCNYFRYGQCNTGVPVVGPIGCRMVSCTPPYFLGIGCDPSGAVDNATANHNANCAAYVPPPPPPPSVLPASASAALVSGAPTVISRGVNGSAYANTFDGSAWSGWLGLGGQFTSRIVLALQGSTLWAFAKGTDSAMWFQARSPSGSWSGWGPLNGQFTSDPAVAVDSAGTLRVFARGTDNALWTQSLSGGAFHGWQSLGGQFTSDPAVAADGSGNVWVFVRGTDFGMWFQAVNTGAFPGWAPLAGQFTSDPAAAVDSAGTVRVFARGSDNAMWTRSLSGGGWQSMGGQFTSEPAAAPDTSGNTWVFARGTDDAMWSQAVNGGAFPGWSSLGGGISADPAAVADSSVWLFALGLDHSMYTRHLVGGSWADWQPLGGAFAPVQGGP